MTKRMGAAMRRGMQTFAAGQGVAFVQSQASDVETGEVRDGGVQLNRAMRRAKARRERQLAQVVRS